MKFRMLSFPPTKDALKSVVFAGNGPLLLCILITKPHIKFARCELDTLTLRCTVRAADFRVRVQVVGYSNRAPMHFCASLNIFPQNSIFKPLGPQSSTVVVRSKTKDQRSPLTLRTLIVPLMAVVTTVSSATMGKGDATCCTKSQPATALNLINHIN